MEVTGRACTVEVDGYDINFADVAGLTCGDYKVLSQLVVIGVEGSLKVLRDGRVGARAVELAIQHDVRAGRLVENHFTSSRPALGYLLLTFWLSLRRETVSWGGWFVGGLHRGTGGLVYGWVCCGTCWRAREYATSGQAYAYH